ncbi:MAG: AraC family transcriptional regulator [Eubacteriales bacterium]|nr:AraC family transcriptional regulator [Eubacteriales bacterium]
MEFPLFTNNPNSIVTSDRILYTPSSFAKASLLYLQEIGSLVANRPHVSRRSNLESYLFFVVLEGAGELIYGDDTFYLKAGDCVFLNCYEKTYAHSTDPKDLWSLSWIHFNGMTLPAIYEKYRSRGGKTVFHPSSLEKFSELHKKLFQTASSTDYIRDMKVNAGLNELLTLLMNESWNPEEVNGKKQKRDMLPIKRYLDEHYNEKIVLDKLASVFYINKFYMTRIFKEQFGISINSYLQQVRITHAKQMLRFTDATLENIGVTCGIGEPNYFSRMFKSVEGITPSEYRKRWKG